MITFEEYQARAFTTAVYPNKGKGNWTYAILGLAGPAQGQCPAPRRWRRPVIAHFRCKPKAVNYTLASYAFSGTGLKPKMNR